MSQYEIIIHKLDAFIRKYYANQLLRGSLIFLGSILLYVLLVTVGEYFFYFSVQIKWTILAILIAVGALALVAWIIVPLLKMQRLGKVISHEQAAQILGQFFPEVDDKLINLLQLKKYEPNTFESRELIAASIDQKAGKLSVLNFNNAVDLSQNRKYLPLLAIPLLAGGLIYFIAPKIFTEGAMRLAQPSVFFAKPAPFTFKLLNTNHQLLQGQDFTLRVQLLGEKIPDEVFVDIDGEQLPMKRQADNQFVYPFEKVQRTLNFRLYAAGYYSQAYKIDVMQKPEMKGMQMELQYPAYTGKANELIQGISDITVPIGTTVKWRVQAEHTDKAQLITGKDSLEFAKTGARFAATMRFLASQAYCIVLGNAKHAGMDSLCYHVTVVEDQYPQVDIQVIKDTTLSQQMLISGTAGDDYLISQCYFVYHILDNQKKVKKIVRSPLKSGAQLVHFTHYFDVATLKLAPGEQVEFYVEAWDNDAVNGSKSRRSQVQSWRAPNMAELNKIMEENAEQMRAGLSSSAAQAEDLKQEYQNLQKDLLNEGGNNWERQQKMQSMLDKNLQLKQQLENLKRRFEEQQKQSETKGFSEELQQKQEALKEQIDNLKDKQLEEQIRKLQELLEQKNPQQQIQQMQQMEQMNKLFQMDMERLQELMKKLEMQMNIEQLAKDLERLAEKQDALQEQTAEGAKANSELQKQQEALKKELEQLMKKQIDDIKSQNENLELPQNTEGLEDVMEDGEDAADEMEKAGDELQKNNRSGAQQSQQNAKNKLAKMSKKLMQMSGDMEMEQIDIDIKATRQLLTNLIRFSFDQEKLINRLKRSNGNSAQFEALMKEQNRLKHNTEMIKDSLFALSKRIFKIAATINKETSDLDQAIARALRGMEARNFNEALSRQQYAMTASNNLALLLNELLANLIQQQMEGGSGSGSGGKPKKGKGQGQGTSSGMMKDIITGQQQMGQGMQQLKQGAAPGGQQGGGQGQGQGQGSSGGNGGSDNNAGESQAETIARLAQQQAQLRRQMQELMQLLNSKGMGGSVAKEIRAIQEAMDKMETDLVFRKNIDELLTRNKEILTRMLEAEKAIQEQEEDNKRSAQAGKDEPRPMPAELSEYLKKQQQMLEQYRKSMPTLTPFYQKMAEEYLKRIAQ